MATRINTKFVIILVAAMVVLTGGGIFAVLQLKKSAADHARLGESFMEQAEQALVQDDADKANQNLNEAARHFITARNKEPRNTEYLRRFIDARNAVIYDDLALATAELRSLLLTHAVSLHDTQGATEQDRTYLYEMIHQAMRMGLIIDGLENLNPLMKSRADTRLLTNPDDAVALRYSAFATAYQSEYEGDEQKRQELLDRLNQVIADDPQDPWMHTALGRYYIGVAARLLNANNNTPDPAYYNLQSLAQQSIQQAIDLSSDDPAARIEATRMMFGVQPDRDDPDAVAATIALRLQLIDQLSTTLSDKAVRDQLYTNELAYAVTLIQSTAGTEEAPFAGPEKAETLALAVVADRPNDPRAYQILGSHYNSRAMYDQAQQALEQGLALKLNRNAIHYLLEQQARLEMLPTLIGVKLNNATQTENDSARDALLDEAETLTDAFAATPSADEQSRDARAHLIRGQIDYVAQRWDDAIVHLRAASTAYLDQNIQTYQLLAQCYTQLGRDAQVIDAYSQIVELQPASTLRLELARRYFVQNTDQATQRARQQIDQFLRYYPGNAQAISLKAQLLYRTGNPDSQQAALDLLQEQDLEANPQLRNLLAQLRAGQGNTADLVAIAREQITNRAEGEPISPSLVRDLLTLLPDDQQKNAEIARLAAEGLTEQAATLLRAFVANGTLTLEQELALIEASGFSPAQVAQRKFAIYQQFNETDLAREQLQLASQLDPDAPQVISSRFETALQDKRWADAEQAIVDILALPIGARPDIAVDNGVFMRALLATIRAQEIEASEPRVQALRDAAVMYERALVRNPNQTDGWIRLGQINLLLDDAPAAKTALSRALNLQSTNQTAMQFMAQAEVRTGDLQSAFDRYEQIYSRNANNTTALNQLTQLALRLGEYQRVIPLRERVRDASPEDIENRRALLSLYAQEQSAQWYSKVRAEMDVIIQAEGMTRQNFEVMVAVLTQSENQDQVPAVVTAYLGDLGDQATWRDHLMAGAAYIQIDETELGDAQLAIATQMEGADSVTAAVAQGQALAARGELAEAIALYLRLAGERTDGDTLRAQAANLYLQMQNLDQASAITNTLAQSPDRYYLLVRIALAQEDRFATALELAGNGARDYPENMRLRLQHAELQLALQNRRPEDGRDYNSVLQVARELREDFPDRAEPMVYQANVLLATLAIDEAFAVLQEARSIAPRDTSTNELYYSLLQFKSRNLTASDPQESLRLAEQALAVGGILLEGQPTNPQLLRSMGEAATMLRRNEEALGYYRRAFEVSKGAGELEVYVQTLLGLGRGAEALALLEDADNAALVNENLLLRALRGRALAATGELDRAAALFGNILASSEGAEAQAMLTSQTIFAFRSDPERAVQIVDEALGENLPAVIEAALASALSNAQLYEASAARLRKYLDQPAEPLGLQFRLMQQLALTLQMGDQPQASKVAYERAFAIMESDPQGLDVMQRVYLLNNLAYMLADQLTGYEDQAVQYARQAVALLPENLPANDVATIKDTLGVALLKAGEIDEAIQVLTSATQDAVLATTLLHLGQAYLANDNNPRARRAFLDAVDAAESENNADIQQEAEQLLEELRGSN